MYRGFGHGGRRDRRGRDPFVILLLLQLYQQYQQLPWKPPLTAALIALQSALYFKDDLPLPPELDDWIPSVRQACLSPYDVVKRGQWWRLLWSPLLHVDHLHLYYNMSSLLLKGATLERRMGSMKLGLLLAELLVLSSSIMAWGMYGLGERLQLDWAWSRGTCAVGFSGVLFALKYVLTYNQEGSEQLWLAGWHIPLPFRVPVKYIAWAELLLIHFMLPNTSFAGHLCGILAGMAHVHLLAPLAARCDVALRRHAQASRSRTGPRFTGSGPSGTRTPAAATWGASNSQSRPAAYDAHDSDDGANAGGAAAAAAYQRAQREQELRRRWQ